MLDGVYSGEIDTKLGRKSGTVVLATQGDAVAIELDAPIIGKQFIAGKANGDSFTARGSMKILLMGKVDYTVDGRVDGDSIRAAIRSNKGDLVITGKRL